MCYLHCIKFLWLTVIHLATCTDSNIDERNISLWQQSELCSGVHSYWQPIPV